MSRVPSTWSELIGRFQALVGDDAEEWLRSAVEARYAATSLLDLSRPLRQVAFQKSAGVVLFLEEEGIPQLLIDSTGHYDYIIYRDGSIEDAAGYPGRRAQIRQAFARYFDGTLAEGPPWQVSPEEPLPTREQYAEPSFI